VGTLRPNPSASARIAPPHPRKAANCIEVTSAVSRTALVVLLERKNENRERNPSRQSDKLPVSGLRVSSG